MSTVTISRLSGEATDIPSASLDELQNAVSGELILPGDAKYDEARTIWNAMIDRKPAVIIRCLEVSDVQKAVSFAREHHLKTSIHGGGHNIAGSAVCDGGVMIDLSQMNTVTVDTKARRAYVGPGATLGDLDKATQAHGLATPVGINSTTGVAGLTLGGGFGWLSRKHGLTVDALRAADIVTADGNLHTINEQDHPDLFWAIRGGGGNFGVVTRFEYELYPVGPELLCGLVVYSHDDGPALLKKYRELVAGLSDETSVWVVMRQAPPLPFLPEEVHGTNVIVFAMCHAGDPEEGKKAVEPVRHFGKPLGEHVGVMPFCEWQAAFDPLLTPGARNYWKTHNFTEFSDGAMDVALKYSAKVPSPHCEVFFGSLGGAVNRVASDATAYSHRDAEFVMNVHSRWEDAGDDDVCIGWARDLFKDMAPFATGGAYVNFMTADEAERSEAAFGGNYERLAEIKKKYDPENLFRVNQNISPGA